MIKLWIRNKQTNDKATFLHQAYVLKQAKDTVLTIQSMPERHEPCSFLTSTQNTQFNPLSKWSKRRQKFYFIWTKIVYEELESVLQLPEPRSHAVGYNNGGQPGVHGRPPLQPEQRLQHGQWGHAQAWDWLCQVF